MVEYSTATGRPLTPCPKGFVRNPQTNRCRKKPCPTGYVRNPETNRCRKKCKPGEKRSTRTKRCVKRTKLVVVSPPKPKRKPRVTENQKIQQKKSDPKRKVSPTKKVVKKSDPKKKVVLNAPQAPKGKKVLDTWNDVIKAWKSGKHIPKVEGSVFWETSVAKHGGKSPYRVKTKSASRDLPMNLPADASIYKEHMKGKKSPVSFLSHGNPPTLLVVPPNTGKNFSHLGTFYKNSTLDEKRALWRKVANELEKKLKTGEKVYVSTHGKAASWLHIRLSSTPKYYVTSVA